jgi:hypothetical protein
MLTLLCGCQNVGPISIDQGRDRYNNILQSTAKEQTLSNIVRAYKREPITYMDVTEVDALTSLAGSVNGGLANIGARATQSTTAGTLAGQVGSVTGGVTYAEAPTVRYIPLLGSGLVQQLATPISTDALESMYNSSWKAGPLFDLATFYQTFDLEHFPKRLNRGIPLRERIGFKVRAGMEASMDGETVFGVFRRGIRTPFSG